GITAYESETVAANKSTELELLIKEALQQGQLTKPVQWHTALGYIQIINKRYPEAKLSLETARKSAGADKNAMAEIRIFELIHTLSAMKKIDTEMENKLLTEFTWLESVSKQGNLRTQNVSAWLRKMMAKKYRDQKDLLKAEFFGTTETFYLNSEQLHAMQNFLTKSGKTPYEDYCKRVYRLTADDLFEFEAIGLALNDDLDNAIAVMEKAGEKAKTELYSNPFNGGIKDCHDCDHALPQKVKYTKLSTLKKMKEMKDKLPADTYNNALLLGNAFYNMNFYGSSRKFYYSPVVDAEGSTTDMLTKNFSDRIVNMTLPVKYYTMALAAATTDEQKAKCTYMLAKCERNEWYNKTNGNAKTDFIAFKNFVELKKYAATKYYQEVIKECGYFRTFARK
ncbi:MAG: hypothetical protein K0S12_1771, partial [Bacteroidetes bacterium]|nr:hypothetical protein [Bacteroidota bacterium]